MAKSCVGIVTLVTLVDGLSLCITQVRMEKGTPTTG